MGINLKFVLLLMAVKTEYVFFWMAAPVTNGLITGESVGSATPAVDIEATAKTSGGIDEQASGGYMPPGTTEEIADWWGVIKSTAPGAQYDDYFERQDLGQAIYFGINSRDPAVSPRSRHCVTAARSFIFMAHYSAMCLTTTARKSRWIAWSLGSNYQVDFSRTFPRNN